MDKIDLLITRTNDKIKLSNAGVLVLDMEYGSVQMETNSRTVRGRSGSIYAGGRYTNKVIKVSGKILSRTLFEHQKTVDFLNALLVDTEPYYITQMLPAIDDLYGFEVPGETSGDLDLLDIKHDVYDYRFKVVCESGLQTSFLGKSKVGVLYDFSIEFLTAELPFGETEPKDLVLQNAPFKYGGTAPNSQLEYPWTLRLTADRNQTSAFTVEFEGRLFEYQSTTAIQAGDVFELKGIEMIKNGLNRSHYTNYEYFILQPKITGGLNDFNTTFLGEIEIIDYVELYK